MSTRKVNGHGLIPDLPSWVPGDAWAGWIEMRKLKKVPNTERALHIALAKLDRLRAAGQNVESVIDQSTERGWTTFYPFKDTTAGAEKKDDRQDCGPAGRAPVSKPEVAGSTPASPVQLAPKVPIPADVRAKMQGYIKSGTRH